jgi:predicted nucleic acid-binding protein
MIVVDTTVWIDYFNGLKTSRTDYLDDLLLHQPIIMGDLILCEVLQGFRSDSDFESARQVLIRFPQVSMLSTELAVKSALNYRDLRKVGISVRKTIDCLIATYCIESGNELLHDDRDFDPFETRLGLKVVHP